MRRLELKTLERLRSAFLSGTAGEADYWTSDTDLALYDRTFARRIGWKWDYVLADLQRRGWVPPHGYILDWGCGSGIAGRVFLEHFGADRALFVRDRSPLAMHYAETKAREEFPSLSVCRADAITPGCGVLLVSHVITELTRPQCAALIAQARNAASVLWVEPGSYVASRALLEVREELHRAFHIVAPCTHQNRCGLLAPEHGQSWCHQFASSPQESFVDGDWVKFAHLAGIDLSSLPLSFMVFDKREPAPPAGGAARMIGWGRLRKGHALITGCDESGVREVRLMQRSFPAAFRRLKKRDHCSLITWQVVGGDVTSLELQCVVKS